MNLAHLLTLQFGGAPCDTPPGRQGPCKEDGSSDGGSGSTKDVQEAYQFYSPNVDENVSFATANKRLHGDDQARFMVISRDVDRQLGLKDDPRNVIGDWSDGAENSVFNIIRGNVTWDKVRYSAAIKGLIANQKAVIPFIAQKGGPDTVYRMTVKDSMDGVRKSMDSVGLQFRTLMPNKNGTTDVVVFDQGTELKDKIAEFGDKHGGVDVTTITGKGEFLGSFDTRTQGRAEYNKVIQAYEKNNVSGRYNWNNRFAVDRGIRPEKKIAAGLWTSPLSPGTDHKEFFTGPEVFPTFHPPSLRKPIKVKLPMFQDGYGKKSTALARAQARADMMAVLRRQAHNVGGTYTTPVTTQISMYRES
jgi:hypothetical protein